MWPVLSYLLSYSQAVSILFSDCNSLNSVSKRGEVLIWIANATFILSLSLSLTGCYTGAGTSVSFGCIYIFISCIFIFCVPTGKITVNKTVLFGNISSALNLWPRCLMPKKRFRNTRFGTIGCFWNVPWASSIYFNS